MNGVAMYLRGKLSPEEQLQPEPVVQEILETPAKGQQEELGMEIADDITRTVEYP